MGTFLGATAETVQQGGVGQVVRIRREIVERRYREHDEERHTSVDVVFSIARDVPTSDIDFATWRIWRRWRWKRLVRFACRAGAALDLPMAASNILRSAMEPGR